MSTSRSKEEGTKSEGSGDIIEALLTKAQSGALVEGCLRFWHHHLRRKRDVRYGALRVTHPVLTDTAPPPCTVRPEGKTSNLADT